ncbi:MAG: DUF5320 domain-containing protein [Candidatus Peribacteraceae bacterium]
MPAFDGTGPRENGPMSGWGRGLCGGFNRGMGRGGGCRGFYGFFGRQRLGSVDEKAMLAEEVQAVSEYLKDLQARQKELGEK